VRSLSMHNTSQAKHFTQSLHEEHRLYNVISARPQFANFIKSLSDKLKQTIGLSSRGHDKAICSHQLTAQSHVNEPSTIVRSLVSIHNESLATVLHTVTVLVRGGNRLFNVIPHYRTNSNRRCELISRGHDKAICSRQLTAQNLEMNLQLLCVPTTRIQSIDCTEPCSEPTAIVRSLSIHNTSLCIYFSMLRLTDGYDILPLLIVMSLQSTCGR